MSLQQVVAPRTLGRQKFEREAGNRLENKLQSGLPAGNSSGGNESPSHERLVYLTTCLIGHNVEVQVKDGSLFSGIFHATNAGKDFGIILKMARFIRTGPRGQKSMLDSISKAPSKTLIIPAKELVQITAKVLPCFLANGVPVTKDGFTDGLQRVIHRDIMLDSSISQSHQVEAERELGRWVPDEDDPQCPELDNIFDGPRHKGWNQFVANETLFGVKSTYNEELYTTKLEKGPQTRELEREASRMAREIEGQETQDLHLAEERGRYLPEKFDIDEETRFSSVYRGVDDSGYGEEDDILLDSHKTEMHGGTSGSGINRSSIDLTRGKSNDGAQVLLRSAFLEEVQTSLASMGGDVHQSGSSDHARPLPFEPLAKNSALDVESRTGESQVSDQHEGISNSNDFDNKSMLVEEGQTSKPEDLQSSLREKKDGSEKGGLSASATAYAPTSHGSSKSREQTSTSGELVEDAASMKTLATQSANSGGRPGSSTSSTSECGPGASTSVGVGLSPSSSMGSFSSEKSTLNAHAKEFKLNPNAKSFIPSQTPLRPASPVSDFYFPTNVAGVPHMPGMPFGIGIGPSFAGHQPVAFNPQVAPLQSPHTYFHPNGPQYGQQMIVGPRPFVYMPTYTPEMPYKGRDF